MRIEYKTTKDIEIRQLKELYEDVEWVAYTENKEILEAIIPNSLHVLSAWDGEELVGLTRAVGDTVYILYIQDILVKTAYHGKGIGSSLLQQMIESNEHIRQKVLMTDDSEKTIRFYEKNGFTKAAGSDTGIAFVKYH